MQSDIILGSILNSAHTLTPAQIDSLKFRYGVEPHEIRRLPPEIQSRIDSSPDNFDAILDLAADVTKWLQDAGVTHLICPGGSPAFMAVLSMDLADSSIRLVFSHSERVAVEKDGVKTSVFSHKHWITV